ncbi:hypothetical protein LNP74_04595 [Klebsiella pneumoniae subsp. pneumoniae]|nr:hypothetical protein [Klebsiella pneumoniae subsp. pneumoniae]
MTTTALCWCSSVSPACSANAGCAIRTGTRPEHLAGRRGACPAYNASASPSTVGPVRRSRHRASGRERGLNALPGGAALARPTELAPACRTPGPVSAQPPPGKRTYLTFVDNFRALETAQLA